MELKIIASIRADAATKIQTSVRLHILNVSRMKEELDVISLYRQNKAAEGYGVYFADISVVL